VLKKSAERAGLFRGCFPAELAALSSYRYDPKKNNNRISPMPIHHYKKTLKPFARKLRSNQTTQERTLWHYLRKKQILNTRFSRQNPIGPYIVDFYAKEAKLVIEIDGSQHYEESHQADDKARDAYLKSLGLSVLRFNNIEISRCLETVIHIIECKIQGKTYVSEHGEFIELW
jgi:very-short-patch-repair endonuclease